MRNPTTSITMLLASCLLLGPAACRREPAPEAHAGPLPLPETARANQLSGAPTSFLRRHASAPIHWQNWDAGLTKTAADSHRLILVFLGSTLYPASDAALAALHGSRRIVTTINDNYLPTLVDVDACRELGIFASVLAAEIRRPVAFPFLLWLSPEGCPVAWTPVTNADPEEVIDLFDQSSSMVASMWRESPEYVTRNSRRDADLRQLRLTRKPPEEDIPGPAQQVQTAITRLRDLYDPLSGGIDGTGGLPPAGVYELLALAAASPALPADQRRECRTILATGAGKLVRSSMIDPLDGGIFLARRGPDWNLPMFTRDTTTQCRMSLALFECWRTTGEPGFLTAARQALAFAENGLGTGDGRVVHGAVLPDGTETAMLWTTEELERRLEPEELRVLSAVSELRGLGNVPLEADPRRLYFRLNVLAVRHTPAELAPTLGRPAAELEATLQSALRKLRQLRDQRLTDALVVETAPYARHHARLASANAAMFGATGDDAHRQRAIAALQLLRTDYFDPATGLRQLPKASSPTLAAGRALDYALTAQACLDVHAITLDAAFIHWAEQLVDLVADHFVKDEQLRESDAAGSVIDVPLANAMMVFEESTAGVLRSVLARLSAYTPSAPPALASALRRELPRPDVTPIVHTDALTGDLLRHLAPLVQLGAEFGGGTPAAVDPAILASGPRRCSFVPATAGFLTAADLAPAQARLTVGSADPLTFNSPAELAAWLRQNLAVPE